MWSDEAGTPPGTTIGARARMELTRRIDRMERWVLMLAVSLFVVVVALSAVIAGMALGKLN